MGEQAVSTGEHLITKRKELFGALEQSLHRNFLRGDWPVVWASLFAECGGHLRGEKDTLFDECGRKKWVDAEGFVIKQPEKEFLEDCDELFWALRECVRRNFERSERHSVWTFLCNQIAIQLELRPDESAEAETAEAAND